MSLVSRLKRNGPSGFGYRSTVTDVTAGLDLSGRTILVTGCRSGLGFETAIGLAKRGARIIGTARAAELARGTLDQAGGSHLALSCQLAEPSSVRDCIAAVRADGARLDAIICNAGIMALPTLQQAHGYELQFFTNHIGHFSLVTGLLDRLTERGRVVMVSSAAHHRAPRDGIEFDNLSGEKHYSAWKAYGQSKLANLLFSNQLAKRLGGSGRTSNALHPGVIKTPLSRHLPAIVRFAMSVGEPLFLKTPAQGAATSCYLAVHPDAAAVSGKYFADCNPATPSRLGRDANLATRLWQESERIVAAL